MSALRRLAKPVAPEVKKDATMSLPDAVKHEFERSGSAAGADWVWLHLGEDALWLARADGDDEVASLSLDLGTQSTARLFFRSDLPSPLELERAIEHVEDELMRALAWAGGHTTLKTSHPLLHSLARAGGHAATVLTRETVEDLFQRLASGSLGDPSALKGLPAGSEAAASLLILRELMHHLNFHQLLLPSSSSGASPS